MGADGGGAAGLGRRRTLVADGLVLLAFVLWSLLQGLGAESMYGLSSHLAAGRVQLMQVVCLVLTAGGAVAIAQRRRSPLAVAAVVAGLAVASLALTGATNGFELGLAFALAAVAAEHEPPRVWTITGAAVVAVLAAAAALPLARTVSGVMVAGNGGAEALRSATAHGVWGFLSTPAWYVTAVPVPILALAGIAVGTLARGRRRTAEALAEAGEARRRELAERERAGEAAERARIAREMHDVVAHSVSVMVALGGGAAAAFDVAPDRARAALDELVDTGRSALADMRRILGVLHDDEGDGILMSDPGAGPAPLEPQPDGADLVRLLERARTAGLPVRATGVDEGALDGVSAPVRIAVFRIVQESLTNVLRHAPDARVVEVSLRRDAGAIDILVADHGAGAARPGASPGSGRGVTGMRQRAAAFGGTLDAGPHEDGWRVRVQMLEDEAVT